MQGFLSSYLAKKSNRMEYGKKIVRRMPKCLHCGDQIKYGRMDKKFCCDECKTHYYNVKNKSARAFRRRVLAQLMGNYEILDTMFKSGIYSIELIDAVAMGFAPGIITSYRRVGKHDEFCCFDIKYIMTKMRIYSISKLENVSLNLQVGTNEEQ